MKQYVRHLVAIVVAIPLLVISYQNCSGQFRVQDQVESAVSSAEGALSADEALKIRNGQIIACPMIKCAAPPENCSYQPEEPIATTDRLFHRRCQTSCGKLVCKGPKICPMLACAAPPEGCQLVPDAAKDENGCSSSCGKIVCNGDNKGDGRTLPPVPVDPPPTPICPQYMPPANLGPYCRIESVVGPNGGCPISKIICDEKPRIDCPLYTTVMPQPGCRYIYSKDSNGCEIRNTVCEDPKPKACPMYMIAKPAPGCYYKGGGLDENGCYRPGILICTKPPIEELPPQPPKYCPMVAYLCSAPPAGCSYGAPSVDENGCSTGCGNLICEDTTK